LGALAIAQNGADLLKAMRPLPHPGRFWGSLLFGAAVSSPLFAALGEPAQITYANVAGAVPLVARQQATPVVVDPGDWPGVIRVGADFQADVQKVAGVRPERLTELPPQTPSLILIGTLGKSGMIERLIKAGKIDVTPIQGKWEAWLTEVVEQPFPGVERALVVVGSDKRGTIYGTYDLSEQIGVSPWNWWADVPPARHQELYFRQSRTVHGSPAVKYRGIFLNDEAPALTGWAREKFGGLNSRFYVHVFELLLRLRANYLWPAMWSNAFNEDDPENPRLADEYGIVMGTSHHEPMVRSQREWMAHGHGPWNYEANAETLAAFWAEGIRRNRAYESLVTIGMRGDGDMAMSPTANIGLLERIVRDQRAILGREMNADATKIPQIWALYKEVQEYYEKGMTVPDDVTLLWSDDNYGNIRRLPTAEERKRSGGAGVYYHIDYVGWPRSYKWLNVTPISKIWEQMHLAREYGADRVWVVNVGDLKPMEFPIEFFLRYAWSPEQWPYERLTEFGRLWAGREFGPASAAEIAALVDGYTKLNGAIKPEWLSPEVFSQVNYDEAARVVAAWKDLDERATRVDASLPAEQRDAFFQLVLWPIRACAIANEMYVTAGRNQLDAFQGRAAANVTAARVRELFAADAELTRRFNDELGHGRWRHFADQTHLGYTGWQQPPRNAMPAVAEIQPTSYGQIGVAIEGARPAWPEEIPGQPRAKLPPLDSLTRQRRWIEVFNRGLGPIDFDVATSSPWLRVSSAKGQLTGPSAQRVFVDIDWSAAPAGRSEGNLFIRDTLGTRVRVAVPIVNQPPAVEPQQGAFVESESFVAMEAMHFTRAVGGNGIEWRMLENFGRTVGAVTPFPVTAPSCPISSNSPQVEFQIHTVSSGAASIDVTVSPTLAFVPGRGLRFGISVDDEEPQTVDLRLPVGDGHAEWGKTVTEAVRLVTSQHQIAKPGAHVIKVWMVDPGVVFQRLVLRFGAVRPSYFGPPESARAGAAGGG
jgi:hypothetical protein